ncbi:hypothetical protein KR222_006724, partial [Zaprionus bogoriensis]
FISPFLAVQRARGLLTKGKNGTNNCFVTIALGKEKYQTSVKDKAEPSVNWNEECELKIPDQGNRAELTLTCLHRNNLGIDEFLGQATLPLKHMDVYDRPRAKWLKLESKPGKEKKNKERGELEVRIAFVVKSGSLIDLSKKDKHKSSIGQLASSVGGSLLSIGQGEKRKSIKKLAGSFSSKLHIRSKKRNADGEDSASFNGSFVSIDTPYSSSGVGGIGGGSDSRRGQRAGEADPGVISEDEDEFVFDNLSHKSSGSSLNIQRSGLQMQNSISVTNFTPRNPSPLLSNGTNSVKGKLNGGKLKLQEILDEDPTVAEMEQLELDFSVRARTLPPPSKPPRTQKIEQKTIQIDSAQEQAHEKQRDREIQIDSQVVFQESAIPVLQSVPFPKFNEWESKLYGAGKYLEIGSSDSLKRRSWETRVPLPATTEKPPQSPTLSSCSSLSHIEVDGNTVQTPQPNPTTPQQKPPELSTLEKRNRKPDLFIGVQPTAQLSVTSSAELIAEIAPLVGVETVAEEKAVCQRHTEEVAKLEVELTLNEQRMQEAEIKRQELDTQHEKQRQRNAKRLEEDQRILSFANRSTSMAEQFSKQQAHTQGTSEDTDNAYNVGSGLNHNFVTPEQSPKEVNNDDGSDERWKERLGKFKYGNKRDKFNDADSKLASPTSTERIIIGHEKSSSQAERRSEISAHLAKKYEGKSREELMLIANGMENEALLQRQRVKELEDYLDNLLLRVMETHPKILQNPYSRTTSAKR